MWDKLRDLIARQPWVLIPALLAAFVLGWAMGPGGEAASQPSAGGSDSGAGKQAEVWTCSMHPQIRQPKPGQCPICGMDLIPVASDGGAGVGPRELQMSEAAKALAEIQTTQVERRFVNHDVRMVGKAMLDETRVKTISAWVGGRLDRLFVDYTGVTVKQGDHMVYMYSPEILVAQGELLQAQRAYAGAAAGSAKESAQAILDASREKLRLWGLTDEQIKAIEKRGSASDHITVNAPVSGIVIHKLAQEGQYVQTGTPIYKIADLSQVWVMLDAYESDLTWLRYGQEVAFEAQAVPGKTFKGRIAFIDPLLNPRTRTLKVRVNVPNPEFLLKPEMFVRAVVYAKLAKSGRTIDPDLAGKWISPMHPEIVKDEPGTCDICGMPLVKAETLGFVAPEADEPPLIVPASAVLPTGTRAVVYVEVPGRAKPTYEGRVITLGPRAGEFYVVLDGLKAGEMVVTNGNFKIDSALQIEAKPSMMSMPSGVDIMPRPGVPGADRMFEGLSGTFLTQWNRALGAYLELQQALAADDFARAGKAARDSTLHLSGVDMSNLRGGAHDAWMKDLGAFKKIQEKLTAASNLAGLREAFALLSEQLIASLHRFGHSLDHPLQHAHCPMAFDNRGGDWLQQGETLLNPYFGKQMLHCGEIKHAFEPVVGESAPPPAAPGGPGAHQH